MGVQRQPARSSTSLKLLCEQELLLDSVQHVMQWHGVWSQVLHGTAHRCKHVCDPDREMADKQTPVKL